ncbi:MAG: Mbeg1-like protein [Lachnospiraceae bacterium]|nr:Mbeg1-like protein [Lachnospiraceae bacterium]
MNIQDNVMTYLRFRGDLTFQQSPFNEVDALIFSILSSICYDGIVPSPKDYDQMHYAAHSVTQLYDLASYDENSKGVTLKEVYKELLKTGAKPLSEAEKAEDFDPKLADDAGDYPASPYRMEMLLLMFQTKRYSQVRLSNFVREIDDHGVMQFSAMHVNYQKNRTYIVFRGTDHSFTGWKEDCLMTVRIPVAGQERALQYIKDTVDLSLWNFRRRYYLGGHSKGGNLAVYTGIFCDPGFQKKILGVYSFDGPGWCQDLKNEEESKEKYDRISDRLHTYIPEYCLVGVINPYYDQRIVVKSFGEGIGQHSGKSWIVEGDHFCLGLRDESSIQTEKAVHRWLDSMTLEEKNQFIDAFFHLVEESEISRFDDIFSLSLRQVISLLMSATKVPAEERNLVIKVLNALRKERKEQK